MNTHHAPNISLARAHPNLNAQPSAYQQGATLLLVEDSRVISTAIRLMFHGTGGRLRRAETLCRARRHLSLYTPDVAIIDLGLPDGSGLDLIREADRRQTRVPLIIAISGQPELEGASYAAGADRFLAKPIVSISEFRAVLAPSCLALPLSQTGLCSPPADPSALRDDLYLALDLLQGPKRNERAEYTLQFIDGLARSLHDADLLGAVQQARQGEGLHPLVAVLRQRLRDQPLI